MARHSLVSSLDDRPTPMPGGLMTVEGVEWVSLPHTTPWQFTDVAATHDRAASVSSM